MNKNKIIKAMPTVLFISGIVGIFVSEVMVARDTLKAEKILNENIDLLDGSTIDDTGDVIIIDKPKYYKEVVKETWKCYIPSALATTLTLTCLIASNRLTAKQLAVLGSAVASTGGLVTKYRKAILERTDEDILHEIDREVASATMKEAKAVTIETPHKLWTEQSDLAEDGEYLFFDPFTKVKFRSTKLAVMGAKYYLNRNFTLGSEAPLSMFYAFLGLELPEEYSYAGWDVEEMGDGGTYWIDIDCVKSDGPDPETGEMYYILEYDFLPGDCEENYYPFGNPLEREGSYVV